MIAQEDISIVVQGPILGTSADPLDRRLTLRTLQSVRTHLPGAQIILSTWKGADLKGLSFDVVVENEDPGPLDLGKVNTMLLNTNRLIASTRNGLLRAERKFSMKLRSDALLANCGFLKYFGKFEARCESWKILKQRVLGSTLVSQNPLMNPVPFNPSDLFHFGLREDVLNIWDIPLIPKPPSPGVYLREHYYAPEQYIWTSFLRKHGEINFAFCNNVNDSNIAATQLSIANNLVLLEPEQLGVQSQKHPINDIRAWFLFTHTDWLKLYQKLCCSKALPPPCDSKEFEYSVNLPPHEGHSAPSEALTALASQTLQECYKTALPDIQERMPEAQASLQRCPGFSFRLMATIIKILKPSVVAEIGTGDGLTTLCLKQHLSSNELIVTFDDVPWNFRKIALDGSDFSDRFCQIVTPLHHDQFIANQNPVFESSDLIVINLNDGFKVTRILDQLARIQTKDNSLVLLENIHSWSMIPVWNSISRPKIDLSCVGHWRGSGLVDWNG